MHGRSRVGTAARSAGALRRRRVARRPFRAVSLVYSRSPAIGTTRYEWRCASHSVRKAIAMWSHSRKSSLLNAAYAASKSA